MTLQFLALLLIKLDNHYLNLIKHKNMKKSTTTLNSLQSKVAIKIASKIVEQATWIAKQESDVLDNILSDKQSVYDLRQMIQALNTGKMTQQALMFHFNDLVGITYREYAKSDNKIVKIASPEENLLQAISKLIDDKLMKIN